MITPRWHKVFADLWSNKTRTLLTILTIAVGVMAVGFIRGMSVIMLADMNADYQSANPHEAILYTDPFDEPMVHAARHVPGVLDAEGRSVVNSRVIVSTDKKVNVTIVSVPDSTNMHIDLLRPISGNSLPPLNDHQLWLEASSVSLLPVKVGDMVSIEMPGGRPRSLRVAGIVRDVSYPASNFTGQIDAFTTPATIEWLGGPSIYNELLLRVADHPTDKPHVEDVSKAVGQHFTDAGLTVYDTLIYNPGRHFSADIFIGVTVILTVLGITIIFLSIFLVINTINVLLSQHVRQIGIMKAIGGRLEQLVGMYVVLIMSFGVLSLLIAIPLGALAAYATSGFMASFLNFKLQAFRLVPSAILLQVVTGLGVPLAAGFVPVMNGMRISVREAISSYGIDGQKKTPRREKVNALDAVVARLFSRPLLISIHNTFRRKGRLFLMLSILTLGGAVFIAVFNLWATFGVVMNEIQGYFLADVNVSFNQPYRFVRLESMAKTIPEISSVEGWSGTAGQVLSPDKTSSNDIYLLAPPAKSKLIKPVITAGRWLEPGDENALVIGNHLLKLRPDLKVGDDIIIKINNQETTWHIVGFYKLVGNTNPPLLYTTYEYLTSLEGSAGMVDNLRVIISHSDPLAEQRVSKELDELFRSKGIKVSQIQLGSDWRAQQASTLDVLVYFLLAMAILIVFVGGLGLMSTMSMNVLERTREIGILRSIGASNGDIMRLVVFEGMMIGVISWVLAAFASIPLTYLMNGGVGAALFTIPLDFYFSWNGLVIWLVVILSLSALASLLPASKTVRLTIRDVLAYE
jgi:putative ABC transport system permease protein